MYEKRDEQTCFSKGLVLLGQLKLQLMTCIYLSILAATRKKHSEID